MKTTFERLNDCITYEKKLIKIREKQLEIETQDKSRIMIYQAIAKSYSNLENWYNTLSSQHSTMNLFLSVDESNPDNNE